mmetsp:Transcript_12065/g.41001  ORF Transcript_12065/g.41001 Transcript_12065/m.41001 type:complete len:246 (-) Transcript_12065:30-767(-)
MTWCGAIMTGTRLFASVSGPPAAGRRGMPRARPRARVNFSESDRRQPRAGGRRQAARTARPNAISTGICEHHRSQTREAAPRADGRARARTSAPRRAWATAQCCRRGTHVPPGQAALTAGVSWDVGWSPAEDFAVLWTTSSRGRFPPWAPASSAPRFREASSPPSGRGAAPLSLCAVPLASPSACLRSLAALLMASGARSITSRMAADTAYMSSGLVTLNAWYHGRDGSSGCLSCDSLPQWASAR